MSNSNIKPDSQVIFISGTPCTGKTSISTKLNQLLMDEGYATCFIKINDLAIERNLVLGEDPDKFYKVIDIGRLNEVLNQEIGAFLDSSNNAVPNGDDPEGNGAEPSRIAIVEGHLSHLCQGADRMIVLRLDPAELEKRLQERDYSSGKINENLEAEALAVCSAEAYEIYGEKTYEIDTTGKSMEELIEAILEIMSGEGDYPVGSIDFMDWFLK